MVPPVCPMNSIHWETLKDHAVPNPGRQQKPGKKKNPNKKLNTVLKGRDLISGLQDWQGAGISSGFRQASCGTHRKQELLLDGYICIFAFEETHAIKFSRSILEWNTLSSVEFEGILCCSFFIWNKFLLETPFCSWSIGKHNIKKVCPESKQEITPGKTPFFLSQKQSKRL